MLLSPANIKDCCPAVLEVELKPPTLLPAKLDDRSNIQGTATSLPPLEVSVEVEGVVGLVGVGVVVEEVEALLEADELREMTPKSILPDDGFRTISWIVPKDWPWLFLTSEFISLLALTS